MFCRLENQSIEQYVMTIFSVLSEYCIFHAKDLEPQNHAPFTFIRGPCKYLVHIRDNLTFFFSVFSKKSPSEIFIMIYVISQGYVYIVKFVLQNKEV